MASLTKFTLSPSNELVYKSTGKLAPSDYTFRKNTVYKTGEDGVKRRIGTLSRKLTKKQAKKIAEAEKSRNRRKARAQAQAKGRPKKPTQGRPRKPSAASAAYGEDWDSSQTTEFPEREEVIISELAKRVKDAAVSVAPPSLQAKIRALSDRAIYKAYEEDQYIFELYFRYHSAYDPPHKSDVSVWIYQFINRIEQYMDV